VRNDFAPRKALATLLCYWTGVPGGIFSPSIAIGAGWGRLLYLGLRPLDSSLKETSVAGITMAAYFAGVTQSPISSYAIIAGMLSCRTSVLPAMLFSSVLGWLFSRIVCKRPLYVALAELLIPPLPRESCQAELRALPPPVYVRRDDLNRRRLAHFLEYEIEADRTSLR